MTHAAPTRTLISAPGRTPVSVNGQVIARDAILREARNHQSAQASEAWKAAATALVVKELLVQEARRLGVSGEAMDDGEGRRETDEEAAIRSLVDREVIVPTPTEAECRRYYAANAARFRSATLTEACHILLAASPEDGEARQAAEVLADQILAELKDDPARFGELAAAHSRCPSASQGGSLGQLTSGSTVPEFEAAMALIEPGTVSPMAIPTRFGLHIVRVARRIEGAALPFDLVRDRIAGYLASAVERRATAQYVARLVSAADIRGVDLAGAQAHRVH
ncbi:peptidylprolyl isomerase [Phreatobacter aquaticus]|uniref:Parvulin-like PPIase n=1 Tax=Phreatobacter aquaticus TaxID=2570229 RepID=A0A4D7QJS7_9HYPH|nr:peptidylprolyl isomerase [Phreatobacter aquaticus]QCK85614.1 peptidylprolyl isomerase [Phreatobacter aquaticus]